jgi:hypothetical protein
MVYNPKLTKYLIKILLFWCVLISKFEGSRSQNFHCVKFKIPKDSLLKLAVICIKDEVFRGSHSFESRSNHNTSRLFHVDCIFSGFIKFFKFVNLTIFKYYWLDTESLENFTFQTFSLFSVKPITSILFNIKILWIWIMGYKLKMLVEFLAEVPFKWK